MNNMIGNILKFSEVQQFRQKWLIVCLVAVSIGVIVSFGYGMIKQFGMGDPWGRRPMSNTALAVIGPIMIFIGIGLPLLFYKLKLLTEIREDGIYIRFFPLSRQTILFKNIVSCEVRTYRPIREYGGWGIRFGRAGKAYNVSGNRGVQLKLKSGKRLLIGSQRPEELSQAVRMGMDVYSKL